MASIDIDIDVWSDESDAPLDEDFLNKVADELLAVLVDNGLQGEVEVECSTRAYRTSSEDDDDDDDDEEDDYWCDCGKTREAGQVGILNNG